MIENSDSITKAVAGNYKLSYMAIFQEAWEKTKGIKATFWLAWLLCFAVGFGISFTLGLVVLTLESFGYHAVSVLFDITNNIINSIAGGVLFTTLSYLAVLHIVGQPVKSRMIFFFNGVLGRLIVGNILMLLITLGLGSIIVGTMMGFDLLILPNTHLVFALLNSTLLFLLFIFLLYISVISRMMLLLIIEKKLTVSFALKVTFRAINKQAVQNIAFCFILMLFFVVATICTLGIGIIWLFPMTMNIQAIWYREIFGIENVGSIPALSN